MDIFWNAFGHLCGPREFRITVPNERKLLESKHLSIDLSLNNAFVLFDSIFQNWSNALNRRRIFLENLGKMLVAEQMSQRVRIPHSTMAAQLVINVREETKPSIQIKPDASSKRRKCNFCAHTNSKYYTRCCLCGNICHIWGVYYQVIFVRSEP